MAVGNENSMRASIARTGAVTRVSSGELITRRHWRYPLPSAVQAVFWDGSGTAVLSQQDTLRASAPCVVATRAVEDGWEVRKTPSWPRSWANFSLL